MPVSGLKPATVIDLQAQAVGKAGASSYCGSSIRCRVGRLAATKAVMVGEVARRKVLSAIIYLTQNER